MEDVRDLISGRLHVEQIVFTQTSGVDDGKPRSNCYLGISCGGRFLLMSLLSPAEASDLIPLRERGYIYARNNETDFVKRNDQPVVARRPRAQEKPDLESSFRAIQSILKGCLQLGLLLVQPGTIRWNGDSFTVEYFTGEGVNRGTVRVSGTEAEKAKFLADLEAGPKDRKLKTTFVRKEHKILTAAEAKAAEELYAPPVPGSIDAKIEAFYEKMERERLQRGIEGHLTRDEQGRVIEINVDNEPKCRVLLEYDDSERLPSPFPNRTRTFLEHAESKPGIPHSELVIHSVQLSDKPLNEDAFDPSFLLQPKSFVSALLQTDGKHFFSDPADRAFVWAHMQQRLGD